MSHSTSHSAFHTHRFAAAVAFVALGCMGLRSSAQTAPQLLPYTTKVVAGGGTSTPAAANLTCPVSQFKTTDAYGDGCLATEILLGTSASAPGPRDAIADAAGNIFFGDYVNGVVHRIDALTGVLSAVAGSAATSPSSGACGLGVATDSRGDGCTSTYVHLSHPTGLVFSPAGDLYIADYGYGEIRKVAATGGVIPAGGGIISLVAGSLTTFGFNVSNATTTVNAATQSILDGPYGMAFDSQGDLILTDEYEAAALAINLNAATTTTVTGVSLAPGSIWKIAGTLTTGGPYCGSSGCTYNHTYTDGIQANSDYVRNAFGIAVDPTGNVYITNEYYDTIQKVATNGILTTYAGINNTPGKTTARGQAGTIAIGSPFGVAADTLGNIYFSDAADGTVWRVDGATGSQFLIGSGYGSSGTGFASTALPGPGIFSLSVDANANLYFGDTEKNTVSEIASGTQFGAVGAGATTQTLDIHFGANDTPAASAYKLTTGGAIFTLGSATCTANSDHTVDCTLPVTATPSTPGAFTGTLQVTSTLGTTASFTLSGNYVQNPSTRTAVSFVVGSTCTGSTFATNTPVTLSASLTANGPSAPTGTITFFANGAQVGTPQNVTNIGTTAAPVYGATLTTTFATANTYTITATYSGDSYFKTSTGTNSSTITTSNPGFTVAQTPYQQASVAAGGSALYSFTIAQNVYTGTLTFACSNLPAGASCVFSPQSVTGTGCSTTNTVALTILTTGPTPVHAGGFGTGYGSRMQVFSLLAGIGLALVVGLRRRRLGSLGRLVAVAAMLLTAAGMTACGNGVATSAGTPSGTSTVVVTTTGTTGAPALFTVTLTVQ